MAEDSEGDLMPTILMDFRDLELLVGKKLPRNSEELTDLLAFVKGEVESLEGEELSIEIKDGNRPDLWAVEGIARALRGVLDIEVGLKQYSVEGSSSVEINVDSRLRKIRPYIAAAVLRKVHLSDGVIREFMYLQDKLDQTYGRKRSRSSIGLYDFSLIKPPLHYTVAKPTEVSFTPLGSDRKMNLGEILNVHQKGLEYGHIVKTFKYWPILLDSREKVLSFPPIINSDDLGKITEKTKDILIEVTGTDYKTVLNVLTLVTLSAVDRSGQILTTHITYPYPRLREDVTPSFTVSEVKLDLKVVGEILGISLSRENIINLLKRARYDVDSVDRRSISVKVPCYRFDIMHPIDIVEDIAILYGYNNIKPRWPQLVTFGEINQSDLISDSVREVMIGLGFQEILSFSMSNLKNLFSRMNLEMERVIEILNPMSERFTCLRSWLIPSLMEFLSSNAHVSYPQKIFEVGECTVLDKASMTGVSDVKKLACLSIHSSAGFSEIKAALDSLLLNFGIEYDFKEARHGAFTEGRIGIVSVSGREIGLVGEINPKVLEEWKLENPTAGFELNLSRLFSLRDKKKAS